jgi:hypothetical protein
MAGKGPKRRKAKTPRAKSTDLKTLLDTIIELGNQMRRRDDFADSLATPAPPAKPAALAQFRKQLGHRVPPSFVTLLSIYDGIANFDWVDLSIQSSSYLCEHPRLDADYHLDEWGMFDLAQGARKAYEPDSIFVFGQGPNSLLLGFLTRERDADGEMAVMEFDPGGPIWRSPKLTTFLEARAKWFRKHSV